MNNIFVYVQSVDKFKTKIKTNKTSETVFLCDKTTLIINA